MNIISYFLAIIILQSGIIESSNNETIEGIHIQIFENVAEISRPISPFDLPLVYSQQQWYDIRPDSFRLVGDYVRVHGQTISFNRTSLNDQKIYIQRSPLNATFTEAIMIDETTNVIHDLVDNTYYSISSDRIRYLSPPSTRAYSVDFTFDTNHVEQLYLRYLQKNIKWKVRYDLLLNTNDTDSILQAYAEIRNDGSSTLVIESAELISGDVTIQSSSIPTYEHYDQTTTSNYGSAGGLQAAAPTISQSAEVAGVYVFSIDETFVLDSPSIYTLPMFRPTIEIERYAIIEKYFRPIDNRGNAQRAYRLRVPDTYLPKGQVFVRESDRLVGELTWSDHSANETNEFNLGEDPDLQYLEYVQLNSRRQAYEANGYRLVLSTYTVTLRIMNNKNRSMSVNYQLKFSSQDNLTLKEDTTDNLLQVDGSTISGVFQINANDEQELKFTFETQ